MRRLTLGERELGSEVRAEHWYLLDSGGNSGIYQLLVSSTTFSQSGLLGVVTKEFLLSGLLVLGGLFALEVVIVEFLINLDAGQIYSGRSGNDVGLVDTTKWHTVDLVWTGHHQETAGKLLQENNTLTTETTRQQDKHGTRGDAGTELGGADGLVGAQWTAQVVGWIEARGLVQSHNALSTVLLTLDDNCLGGGWGSGGSLGGGALVALP